MKTPTIPADAFEVHKTIVFASSHMEINDDYRLEQISKGIGESEVMVDKDAYGFRVYIHTNFKRDTFNQFLSNVRDEGFSEAFCVLLDLAYIQKAQWMKTDCDGSTYKQLPTFDW